MRQALGRARAILEDGVPGTIWTTEELREFPVRVTAQPHTAVIDAVEVLWLGISRTFLFSLNLLQGLDQVLSGDIITEQNIHTLDVARIPDK